MWKSNLHPSRRIEEVDLKSVLELGFVLWAYIFVHLQRHVPYPTRRTIVSKIPFESRVRCYLVAIVLIANCHFTWQRHSAYCHFLLRSPRRTQTMDVDAERSPPHSVSILTKYYSSVGSLRTYLSGILQTSSEFWLSHDVQIDRESFMNLLDTSYVGIKCISSTNLRVHSTMLDMREVWLFFVCFSST